jgi:hypothetical protein
VAGRQFSWGRSTSADGWLANISCFDTLANARGSYDRNAATNICLDGAGNEVDGQAVVLPVQLGDESHARFCPGYGPDSQNPYYELSAYARVGNGTIYFLRNSTQELSPDTTTVGEFARFAEAFLIKAAE